MENNINEIIKIRRATPPRFLAKTEISKEIIQQLLENANWAPTHKNTEPWRFRVYTGVSKQKLANEIYSLLTNKVISASLPGVIKELISNSKGKNPTLFSPTNFPFIQSFE